MFRLELDRKPSALPLFEQIRAYLRSAIAEGSLATGTRLPPERQLAAMVGVSRSTVMRAYQELVADGLLRAAPSRGTVVSGRGSDDQAPAARSWVFALPPLTALGPDAGLLREIVGVAEQAGAISFASSAPPEDLIPVDDLSAFAVQAFEEQGARLLSYSPVYGTEELRTVLADRMRALGLFADGDSVIVLSGSTQGLALAAHVLIEPGDEVVVEAPAYIGTIQTFELAGARLIGVPVDSEGIQTDALGDVLTRRPIRLMVVQPNFHNPTGVSLSDDRRERILWLARRHRVPILEDDAYGALYHSPPAPGSLKQLDRHGLVIYLSTFSKTLAPGLRIAWMCAPEPVIGRIALGKQFSDLNTNTLGQALVARMIATGRYDANLDRYRSQTGARMRAMLDRLDAMQDVLERDLDPHGGLHVWARLRVGDAATAAGAAAHAGVAVLAGTSFYPRGSQGSAGRDRIRLSLPFTGENAIEVGTRRLHDALKQLAPRVEPAPSRRLAVIV